MFWLIVITLSVVYWFAVATKPPKHFPPGPRISLPVIGNTLDIGPDVNSGMKRLQATYGDIFGIYRGNRRAVVVSDFDLIQEVGSNPAFANRPIYHGLMDLRGGMVKVGNEWSSPGLLMSNGRVWREQRRFALQTLRNLGFGKADMEKLISEEVLDLCKTLKKTQSNPVDVRHIFQVATVNALWIVISGKKLSQDNENTSKLVLLIDNLMQQQGKSVVGLIIQYNFLYDLLKNTSLITPVSNGFQGIEDLLDEMILEHEKTFQEDNLKDFTDFYLKEINNWTNSTQESSFSDKIGRRNLVNTLRELFVAGSDTTSTTLTWSMLFLALNPDIQAKIQKELDAVTGGSRLHCVDDRPKTPYTEAFIHEVQRCGDVGPLSVFREAGYDAPLGKYVIPKGTTVFQHLASIHFDPEIFPQPRKFDPSRYICDDGTFKEHPRVVPFGVGKRMCPGKPQAKMSLYLFLTGIVSNFTVTKAHPNDYLSPSPMPGGTQSPFPFKIRLIPRDEQ